MWTRIKVADITTKTFTVHFASCQIRAKFEPSQALFRTIPRVRVLLWCHLASSFQQEWSPFDMLLFWKKATKTFDFSSLSIWLVRFRSFFSYFFMVNLSHMLNNYTWYGFSHHCGTFSNKIHKNYTGARKDPPGKQKFDRLCPIFLEPLVLQISYIPHWKAVISSFWGL